MSKIKNKIIDEILEYIEDVEFSQASIDIYDWFNLKKKLREMRK